WYSDDSEDKSEDGSNDEKRIVEAIRIKQRGSESAVNNDQETINEVEEKNWNLKCVEGGELFIEPKLEDDNKLVFDREKLITSNDKSLNQTKKELINMAERGRKYGNKRSAKRDYDDKMTGDRVVENGLNEQPDFGCSYQNEDMIIGGINKFSLIEQMCNVWNNVPIRSVYDCKKA
ncbi:3777_t:CDS:2, partial [Dentiscutata erythropus]